MFHLQTGFNSLPDVALCPILATLISTAWVIYYLGTSVASAIAGVFANFPNKIAKITEKFEHVDETKS